MKKLTALVPILYGNKQYGPGDVLPITDSGYVSAWTEAGSAVWKDGEEAEDAGRGKKKVKAKPVTAPAGAAGIAQPAAGAEQDLVGKVPGKKARGVVKECEKTAPRSKA